MYHPFTCPLRHLCNLLDTEIVINAAPGTPTSPLHVALSTFPRQCFFRGAIMQPFQNCFVNSVIGILKTCLKDPMHENIDSKLSKPCPETFEAINYRLPYYHAFCNWRKPPLTMETKAYLVVTVVLLVVSGFVTPSDALKINSSSLLPCSSTCESKNCKNPFEMRYGKYCGLGYTGCAGQAACDGLDQCCLTHDNCVGLNLANYSNVTCNDALITCVKNFRSANSPQFVGSNCSETSVEAVLVATMTAASNLGSSLGIGRPLIHKYWIEALVSILSAILIFG